MARILVADDEQTMRHMVRLACERSNHEIHEAVNAPTAIEAYARLKPDLLILDIGMPGGGGTFVLNSLRFGGTRRIGPVLVITGSMEGHADEIRMRLAVDRVLLKPFRIADLIAVVNELVPKAPARPASPQGDPAAGLP